MSNREVITDCPLCLDAEDPGKVQPLGKDDRWVEPAGRQAICIGNPCFAGTGTRFLEANGRKAIRELFARSFA